MQLQDRYLRCEVSSHQMKITPFGPMNVCSLDEFIEELHRKPAWLRACIYWPAGGQREEAEGVVLYSRGRTDRVGVQ